MAKEALLVQHGDGIDHQQPGLQQRVQRERHSEAGHGRGGEGGACGSGRGLVAEWAWPAGNGRGMVEWAGHGGVGCSLQNGRCLWWTGRGLWEWAESGAVRGELGGVRAECREELGENDFLICFKFPVMRCSL